LFTIWWQTEIVLRKATTVAVTLTMNDNEQTRPQVLSFDIVIAQYHGLGCRVFTVIAVL